jgi:hypothetical protein
MLEQRWNAIGMGAKSLRRLSDMAFAGSRVEAKCTKCRHVGCVDPNRVCIWLRIRRYSDLLETVGARFLRSRCGERNPRLRPTSAEKPVSFPGWALRPSSNA